MKIKFLLFAAISIFLLSNSYAQKRKNAEVPTTPTFKYEAEAADGQAAQGYSLIKVYSYSQDQNTAIEEAGRNAVHAILFKGYADYNNGSIRIKGQRPLITDVSAYETNENFFKEFFKDGGKYLQFVQYVNNGIPEPGDAYKVGKEYKVGLKVLVNKTALRKYMEEVGIINALGSGF